MKTTFLNRLVIIGVIACTVGTLVAAEEDDLIVTLQSGVGAAQKSAACQRLRVMGTAKSVPALAALLSDERCSQFARHALEAIPQAEAGAALRAALGTTSGPLKAGVADSLGWRRDTEALPQLLALLSDADPVVAEAAAGALGRIGGKEAAAALDSARGKSAGALREVIVESLMKCAEASLAAGDATSSEEVYRLLLIVELPVNQRVAAWRGLAVADSKERELLVTESLAGADKPKRAAAQKLVRELGDSELIKACVGKWDKLPADSQAAVLDAQAKLGAEALPTLRAASGSPDMIVRIAAWEALATLADPTLIPALARAAARGEPPEREPARLALARMRGTEVREALLAGLEKSEPAEKAELLRALGERFDTAAARMLVKHAESDVEVVRNAALESLRRLAAPDTIAPLLDLATRMESDAQREPVIKALYAICRAAPDKAQVSGVITAIGKMPPGQRRAVLGLLAELSTPEALAAAQTAARDVDAELAKEALRVLGRWANAAPVAMLLETARAGKDGSARAIALRGAIAVSAHEANAKKRLELLTQAMAATTRPEEQRLVLAQLGQVTSGDALALALKHMDEAALTGEAALAAIGIAERLATKNPELAEEAAARVLAKVKDGDAARRALQLSGKPAAASPFIREWVVAGPFAREGAAGAEATFNIAFAPEKAGEAVQWRNVQRTDHVNLAAIFPDRSSCAAYLRTRIIAPEDCAAVLLMGSDDGIKAWLNGEVVHSNNVDRGEVADQDRVPIKLRKGANDLLLKITQGGGGWSACARIVATDGKAIQGLRHERPAAQP